MIILLNELVEIFTSFGSGEDIDVVKIGENLAKKDFGEKLGRRAEIDHPLRGEEGLGWTIGEMLNDGGEIRGDVIAFSIRDVIKWTFIPFFIAAF